ncbi:unnamed protein product [Musa acuminata subsp. malaccensis]|uniref:(wild Malaysian banana) hypothetical protein n=1 Tax=Musa acuminata subsp. malaccensis TaxID=214687 RepID=A0A804LBM2_MUSAM|nr:unnamed protein product [Musa acuminata subsp. malaccensis]
MVIYEDWLNKTQLLVLYPTHRSKKKRKKKENIFFDWIITIYKAFDLRREL